MDLEWGPGSDRNDRSNDRVSVLILNTPTVSLIIHITKIGHVSQCVISDVLKNGMVKKVGLNFQGDLTRLAPLSTVYNTVDVSVLANGSRGTANGLTAKARGQCWALSDLLKALLQKWLDKDMCGGPSGKGSRFALWRTFPLDTPNRQYCSNDGDATLMIFLKLMGIYESTLAEVARRASSGGAQSASSGGAQSAWSSSRAPVLPSSATRVTRSVSREVRAVARDEELAGPAEMTTTPPAALTHDEIAGLLTADVRNELSKRGEQTSVLVAVARQRISASVSPPAGVATDADTPPGAILLDDGDGAMNQTAHTADDAGDHFIGIF